jgi:hypothetical protein
VGGFIISKQPCECRDEKVLGDANRCFVQFVEHAQNLPERTRNITTGAVALVQAFCTLAGLRRRRRFG